MSILSGYEKYKRHLKVDDENYKLVSEWTHSDTVEMDDGKSLTETITSLKNQTSSFIGNEYSSSSTYKVGDYCVYEGKWYRCIVDITTPETWNHSNWTLTNISDEVTEVQELGQYIRYNQTDETIQVLNNDKWVDIKSIGFTKKYIFKGDDKLFAMETGGLCCFSEIVGRDSYEIVDGSIQMNSTASSFITDTDYGVKPNFYTYDSVSFFGYSKLVISWDTNDSGITALIISTTPDFSEFIILANHDNTSFSGIEEISLINETPHGYNNYWGKYYIGFAVYGELEYGNWANVNQLYLTV